MKYSYSQILDRLFSVNELAGMKLGLKNCLDMDRLLANPSKAFPSIHVAGTNGKGSVSTKIAATHEAAGFKTGLYTSPHLSCFRERIRINSHMISEKQVEKHMNTLFSLCDAHKIKSTFFELTTLMAFLHFAEENVDIAVLETGLGGRLDATNIVSPKMSVITSISLEHTEILGNTIDEIAMEKAGIIKHSIPVIIGPKVPFSVIQPVALKKQSPCMQVKGHYTDYHEENCAIANMVLEQLQMPNHAIHTGLKALPPCRLQTFTQKELLEAGFSAPLPKAVILDVAHNPDALKELLRAIYNQGPFRFVIGLSSNKDIAGCLNVLKNEASAFHLVEAANERAASNETLAKELLKLGVSQDNIVCEASITSAIQNAIKLARNNHELVIVCGTFFIMNQARKALGIVEPQDPKDMN